MKTTQMSLGDLLTESSIDAMIAINTDLTIIAWNRAATLLFDVRKEAAIGLPLSSALPSINDDSALQTAIGYAKNGKQSYLPPTNAHVHRSHVETHIVPLQNESDVTNTGIMLLIHDVSHRIVKEEQLEQLNKELHKKLKELKRSNRELADLTHIASHDIKEPIRNLYTTIEKLIRTETRNLSDNGKAAFRRMQASLNRMNLLLDDIITVAQINLAEHPVETIKMDAVIESVRRILEPKLRETKAVLSNGELCEIKAHKNQLILLLQHVLSNALKYNTALTPTLHIECGKKESYYELVITHNGESPDMTTIAMVIASRIMESHSGYLETSKNEKETIIKCFFPV